MATLNANRKVERQKELFSIAEKSTNKGLNYIGVFWNVLRMPVYLRRSYYLIRRRYSSTASSQMVKACAEACHTRNTILTQSRKLETIAQLKISIESLGDIVDFHNTRAESSKRKLSTVTMEVTRIGPIFDSVSVEVADLREWLGTRMRIFEPSLIFSELHLSHLSGAWLRILVWALISQGVKLLMLITLELTFMPMLTSIASHPVFEKVLCRTMEMVPRRAKTSFIPRLTFKPANCI